VSHVLFSTELNGKTPWKHFKYMESEDFGVASEDHYSITNMVLFLDSKQAGNYLDSNLLLWQL